MMNNIVKNSENSVCVYDSIYETLFSPLIAGHLSLPYTELITIAVVFQTDRAAMLDEIVDYVKFLRLQVKV